MARLTAVIAAPLVALLVAGCGTSTGDRAAPLAAGTPSQPAGTSPPAQASTGRPSSGAPSPAAGSADAVPPSVSVAPGSASPGARTAAPTSRPRASAAVRAGAAAPVPGRSARRSMSVPRAKAAFRASSATVSASSLGTSWRSGCPVPPSDLRALTLTYWGFDARIHSGVLIVHRTAVRDFAAAFGDLFAARFPIRSIRPVSEFGASDDASMAADNTSAFNCRRAVAAGPPSWSRHAYGLAVDINPVENPYLFDGDVLPPNGAPFRSRAKARPGLIRRGDVVHRAFVSRGFGWGGEFRSPDYQHFDRR